MKNLYLTKKKFFMNKKNFDSYVLAKLNDLNDVGAP